MPSIVNFVQVALLAVALGYAIAWQSRSGKAYFVAFLALFLAGHLLVSLGMVAREMGLVLPVAGPSLDGYMVFLGFGSGLRLLSILPLVAYAIVSRGVPATPPLWGHGSSVRPAAQRAPSAVPPDIHASFPKRPASELQRLIAERLPPGVRVTVSEGKRTEVRIAQGLWRGAWLELADEGDQSRVARVSYDIPSLFAKMLLFVVALVVLSILISALAAALTGYFALGFVGLGGAAGYAMYFLIKTLVASATRSAWAAELAWAVDAWRS
jgi:hypothetical protein